MHLLHVANFVKYRTKHINLSLSKKKPLEHIYPFAKASLPVLLYYVSRGRGGRGFEQMLTFAYQGGRGGLAIADVSIRLFE